MFSGVLLVSDGEAQPSAGRSLPPVTGRREDEGVRQDDPLPGVMGGRQALRQPPPPRQHDHGQRQDQHHRECSAEPRLSQTHTRMQLSVSNRLTPGLLSSGCSDGAVPLPATRKVSYNHQEVYFQSVFMFNRGSFHRSKSQRRRFEEELNERMIRTIDGINSQK